MSYFTYKNYKENNRNILEVDILPEKYCNFDCIFCPIGRSKNKTDIQQNFSGTKESICELVDKLDKIQPDMVFINSKGEAMLNSQIKNVIELIRQNNIKVRLLSNGYILNKEPYMEIANLCDEVIGEIKIITETDFQKVQRPMSNYTLSEYISGMANFKKQYPGTFILEITILNGYNDDSDSVSILKNIIKTINPDELKIKTEEDERFIRRLAVSKEKLFEIETQLNKNKPENL